MHLTFTVNSAAGLPLTLDQMCKTNNGDCYDHWFGTMDNHNAVPGLGFTRATRYLYGSPYPTSKGIYEIRYWGRYDGNHQGSKRLRVTVKDAAPYVAYGYNLQD